MLRYIQLVSNFKFFLEQAKRSVLRLNDSAANPDFDADHAVTMMIFTISRRILLRKFLMLTALKESICVGLRLCVASEWYKLFADRHLWDSRPISISRLVLMPVILSP
jgi:hypothetical protein